MPFYFLPFSFTLLFFRKPNPLFFFFFFPLLFLPPSPHPPLASATHRALPPPRAPPPPPFLFLLLIHTRAAAPLQPRAAAPLPPCAVRRDCHASLASTNSPRAAHHRRHPFLLILFLLLFSMLTSLHLRHCHRVLSPLPLRSHRCRRAAPFLFLYTELICDFRVLG